MSANTHPIPDAALKQHTALLGKTGSGKTYTAKGVVERLLERNERVTIVDPTGVYWGMRLDAKGKKASPFEIVIFGGRHGDLPLGAGDGERLAEIVGTSTTPVILDTQLMSVSHRTRFFTAFAEGLLKHNRGPHHLVIDEAHLFAPQSGGAGQNFETAQLLHATNNLVSLGRSAGLRIILITQRPAKLHKDSLTQVETLIAMRLIAPPDRKAVKDWLDGAPDKSYGEEIMTSLASLPQGTGWVYAPEQGVLLKATFPAIKTFDSGRPLEAGELPALKPIDVAAIKAAMSQDPASDDAGKRDNPVAKAGRQPNQKNAAVCQPETAIRKPDSAELEAAEAQGFAKGFAAGAVEGAQQGWLKAMGEALRNIGASLEKLPHFLDPEAASVIARAAMVAHVSKGGSRPGAAPEKTEKATAKYSRNYSDLKPHPPVTSSAGEPTGTLNSAARKMLAVLDTDPPVRRSWQQVATLAGLKARGGHFNAGKKALVDAGLIIQDGVLVAIANPRADAKPDSIDPPALLKTWCDVLKGAAPKILRALFVDHFSGSGSRSRIALAAELGMQPRGGHWNAAWKELRDNGLVVVDGSDVRLADLFGKTETP